MNVCLHFEQRTFTPEADIFSSEILNLVLHFEQVTIITLHHLAKWQVKSRTLNEILTGKDMPGCDR